MRKDPRSGGLGSTARCLFLDLGSGGYIDIYFITLLYKLFVSFIHSFVCKQ